MLPACGPSVGEREGLPTLSHRQLLFDTSGTLWMGGNELTNDGLRAALFWRGALGWSRHPLQGPEENQLVASVRGASDGTLVVGSMVSGRPNKVVFERVTPSGSRPVADVSASCWGGSPGIRDFVVLPGGRVVAAVGEGCDREWRTTVWELDGGGARPLGAPVPSVEALAVDPAGQVLRVVRNADTLQVERWDASQWQRAEPVLPAGDVDMVEGLRFGAAGELLLLTADAVTPGAGAPGTLRLHRRSEGAWVSDAVARPSRAGADLEVDVEGRPVVSFAADDGVRVARSSDAGTWDVLATGALTAPGRVVYGGAQLALAPDGSLVAAWDDFADCDPVFVPPGELCVLTDPKSWLLWAEKP
jgi:hypothetical protein